MIRRKLEKKIREALKKYAIILITGPRQSGKTTLVRNLFPNFLYTNLEAPDIFLFAQEDPRAFLSQNKKMIIDEVQKSPHLLSYLQVLVDQHKDFKFVLTGSQNLLLLEKITQTLAGRVAIFELFPFDFGELKKAELLKKTVEEQIFAGSYPPVYAKGYSPAKWYEDYITTYVQRDIRELLNIRNFHTFLRFLKLAAGHTAQIVNLSSFSVELGVAVNTVKEWFSLLEASYIVFFLYPFYRNFNKRIIKSPKLYFYDTGLVCSLLSIKKKEELNLHPLKGALFENLIISEIKKLLSHRDEKKDLYFWRDRSGREIDLVFEREGKINAFEIKATQTFSPKLFSSLLYFDSLAKMKIEGGIIYGGKEKINFQKFQLLPWFSIEEKI